MKLTPRRRYELMQIYLNLGLEVSAKECLESGVCRTYGRVLAGERGFHFPRPKAKPSPVWKIQKTHNDPRWSFGRVTGGQ